MAEYSEYVNTFGEKDLETLSRDTAHLTDLNTFLPDNVWTEIVQKLGSVEDIESCSNSSLYFGRLLFDQRHSKVVLPKAFEKLIGYLEDEGYDPTLNIINDQENKNNLKTKIWKCRAVSKSWNLAFEKLIRQNDVIHYNFGLENTGYKHMRLLRCSRVYFGRFPPSPIRPQELVQRFDSTHYDLLENKHKGNPILGRSLHFRHIPFWLQMEEEHISYINGILELLTKYGSEIWFVLFDFHHDRSPIVHTQIYERFRHFLTLLPNLKSLQVHYWTPFDEQHQHDLRNDEYHQLEQAMEQSPLPILPKLEYLSTQFVPAPIFNELLKRNGHITQLQVHHVSSNGDYATFLLNLPNLTALSLYIGTMEQYESFENYRFPIKVTKVLFKIYGIFVSWSRVFHALECKFGDTCSELILKMPDPGMGELGTLVLKETHLSRLNFPKLKKITIFEDTPMCLDFLLHSKETLTDIIVEYKTGRNESASTTIAKDLQYLHEKYAGYPQTIQILGYKDDMSKSNIWEKLPKLRSFTMERSKEMGGPVSYNILATGKQGDEKFAIYKFKW